MWYAVHILTGFYDPDTDREEILIEENVHIVECESMDEAARHATRLAEQTAQVKVSYLDPGRTVMENFGVRKVLEISNPELGNEEPPHHETEVTYEVMRFKNREDVELFRRNVSVRAVFWTPETK